MKYCNLILNHLIKNLVYLLVYTWFLIFNVLTSNMIYRGILITIVFHFTIPFSAYTQYWKEEYDSCRARFNRGEIEKATLWLENFIEQYKNAVDKDTLVYFEMVNLLGRCFLKQGYNTDAEAMFKEEINYFRKNPKDISKSTYSTSLLYLGYMYYNLKKYDEAEKYFEEVIQIRTKYGDLPPAKHISLTNKLAVVAMSKKDFNRADSLFNKELQLKKQYYGDKHKEYAVTLRSLGNLYKKTGKYPQSETMYRQALEVYKKTSGENSQDYINTYSSLCDLYKMQGRYAELDPMYKKLSDLVKNVHGSKSVSYAKMLKKQVELARALSKYTEAEPLALLMVKIIEDTIGQNNLDYCSALIDLAGLYKDMGKFNDAEMYHLLAISIYETIVSENHESYVKALVSLATLYTNIGRTNDAEPLFLKTLAIYKRTTGEMNLDYADLLNQYGLYLYKAEHYEQSELYFKKALEITEKLIGKKNINYTITLDNLATLYTETGHLEQAEPIMLEAGRIRKELLGPKHPLYATSLNNIANLYLSVGRTAEAFALYEEAIKIIKEIYGTRNPYYANALDNLSAIYEKEGDMKKAETFLKESLEITRDIYGERHEYYIKALNNLALLYTETKNTTEAEKLYKANLEKIKQSYGENSVEYAVGLSNLADLYEVNEKYKNAEELYEKALKIKKDKLGVNHEKYTFTLVRLAGLYSAIGEYEKADALWQSALGNYLTEIKRFFPTMSEKEKQQFYKNVVQKEFEYFNTYAINRASTNPEIICQMYNNQLATKAIILNASNKVRQRIMSGKDTSLINLYKKWQQQKEYLAKLYSFSKAELESEKINIDSIQRLANTLEKRLSQRSEVFRTSADTQTYTWKKVYKVLRQGEAAIEIIRFVKYNFRNSGVPTDTIVYAALIITNDTKKHPEMVLMENGRDLEKKYINYYKNVIKFKIEDEYTYEMYWKKIAEKLTGIKKVYISPDGVYNQINLNTIKNKSTGKYLIEEIDIQMVSNTKDLLINDEMKNNRKNIVLFGNPDYTADLYALAGGSGVQSLNKKELESFITPLPGTEAEVTRISNIVTEKKWSVQVYKQRDANEKNLKNISNPRVLHIATHGFFDKDLEVKRKNTRENPLTQNPLLRSGLLLAGASVTMYNKKHAILPSDKMDAGFEDGVLTAYEAMNLNLDSTDLVLLSACETGLGDIENGEGVYGLQRALIIAGSEAVVISLWKVDDATTSELMTLFFNEWLKPNAPDKLQAFKNAQLALKKKYPDPYYWGAFVMIGE
ncbi:MAG: tetratricopeptide repeat protein [Cytophagaceae bacterium]|nr:tetratricopeptide repeat protein [Cytophagaceae bacterium]MDW8456283.1 tetratricopeptide repeat protein [Cytophagaceae bacterium]